MSDLAGFLAARLNDDERSVTLGRAALDDLRFELKRGDPYEQRLSSRIEDGLDAQSVAWEARVLREVAAKRAILAEHPHERMGGRTARREDVGCTLCGQDDGVQWHEGWCATIRALAAVYADHPEFDPAWKPA